MEVAQHQESRRLGAGDAGGCQTGWRRSTSVPSVQSSSSLVMKTTLASLSESNVFFPLPEPKVSLVSVVKRTAKLFLRVM